jgi:hypothetical protein
MTGEKLSFMAAADYNSSCLFKISKPQVVKILIFCADKIL